ncbi:ABC transporter substrate-binding protein [Rhodococcus qingshengii]|uniref:ABC transporter substrate-binding protein n=1 Tax=Rhodococcus qingshengii TaxID=334542 RepID=UPI0036DD3ACB
MRFPSVARFAVVLGAAVALVAGCTKDGTSDQPVAADSWSYTTGYGNTIALDTAPKRIVVDSYSAAALWDYGIRPVGIFGYGHTDGQSTGTADLSSMTVVGTDGEMNIEALVALEPDVVIGYGGEDPSSWAFWDKPTAEKVNSIAPFVSVKYNDAHTPAVLAEYRNLAAALGADTDGGTARADRDRFDAGSDRIRRAVIAKSGITMLPLSGDASTLYAATTKVAQLAYLQELGVTIAGPSSEEGWPVLSWEQVMTYPADIVMQYVKSRESLSDAPIFARLPAVVAGQVVVWDDKRPNTYANYAQWFDELATSIENARKIA